MLGHIDRITRNYILGWAADPERPNDHVSLAIVVDGRKIANSKASIHNEHLSRIFAGSTGRYGFRFEFDWPLSIFEDHSVEVRFENDEIVPNGKARLLRICSSLDPNRSKSEHELLPVIVTSTGRAGSSFCMALLAKNAHVAVGGDHPYEVKLLTYYAQALRVLCSQADRLRSCDPDTMAAYPNRFHIGFNPFNDEIFGNAPALSNYWNNVVPTDLANAFSMQIEKYYGVVAEMKDKKAIRSFAEKAQPNPLVRAATTAMFGKIREIVLIRDPRDLLCSYKAFWKSEPMGAIRTIKSQMDYLVRHKQSPKDDVLFVKYEDLVADPEKIVQGIYRFIDVEDGPSGADGRQADVFTKHGTSGSPEKSIGRWKNDLNKEERQACAEQFSTVLEEFCYE
jgi:hypothetical protein